MKTEHNQKEKDSISESEFQYLIEKAEEARLRDAISRSDVEKFNLFTRMLRRNAMFKRAVITHKQ